LVEIVVQDKARERQMDLKSPHGIDAFGRRLLLGGGGAALAAAALPAPPARAAEKRTIRIGYQRYGTLIILKHTGLLEAALAKTGDTVIWSEFPAGPQMLQAMLAGALDFGIAGDTPPVFALAARPDGLVYVGHEPKAPAGEAILVPGDSPIRSVADLKGKSVALNKGSNVHWLLLAALQKAGLGFGDIRPVYLVPAAGRAAFDTRRVDAWAIWDPYLSSAQTSAVQPRILASADGLVGNRQFFLAARGFATQNADLVSLVVDRIAASDAWGQAHKDDVSRYLAGDTGLPFPVVRRAVERLTFGVKPMDDAVIAEQQAIADAFHTQGLIPTSLTVKDAVWKPPA